MRVLIYKRTHSGDPNVDDVFGYEDCMGGVRGRRFDAVIGVGGIGPESQRWGVDRRPNWVGVGAHSSESVPIGYRGPLVTFDRFLLLEEQGPELQIIAPALARYMYAVHRRVVMSDGLNPTLKREIKKILSLAPRSPNRTRPRVFGPRKRGRRPRPCTPPQACENRGRRGKQNDNQSEVFKRCRDYYADPTASPNNTNPAEDSVGLVTHGLRVAGPRPAVRYSITSSTRVTTKRKRG
jgi:hypothetical protein